MSHQRPTILIIDQDPSTRELYRRELALLYRVFACADENEARQVLSLQKMNVLVLEPVGCGWDLFYELKGSLPVIVCSTSEVRNVHIRKQLAACLVKPVLPANLLDSVQCVLAAYVAE